MEQNVVLVGVQIWKSGIRFDENRQAGPIAQLPCKGENFSRAQRAVDSHRVRAQSFQRERHGGNGNASEGAAVRLKAHGTEHGQGGVLFCGKERGFDLQKIGHGFKHQKISASFRPRCNGFAENIIGLLKPKVSVRFQQRTDRAAGESDKRSGFLCRFPRAGDTRLNNFPRRKAASFQFAAVCSKGIGVQNLCPCLRIGTMDSGDVRRMGQIQRFGVFPQGKTGGLKHGAHCAVQNRDMVVRYQHVIPLFRKAHRP